MHDTLANKGHVSYDPYTPEQQYGVQKVAEAFLTGQTEEIEELSSMRQVKELLAQMKNFYLKLKQDGKNILEAEDLLKGEGSAESEKDLLKRRSTLIAEGVGEVQEVGEFGLGVAPRESRPINKIELTKEKEAEIREAQAFEEDEKSQTEDDLESNAALMEMVNRSKNKAKRKPVQKQSAFMEFKESDECRGLEQSVIENRQALKEVKARVKELTEGCNAAKKNIDVLKAELDKKQDERRQNMQEHLAGLDEDDLGDPDNAPQEIIDEDELAMLQRMKELKKAYRASYADLKAAKNEVAHINLSIDTAKMGIVTQFEAWYEDTFETADGRTSP